MSELREYQTQLISDCSQSFRRGHRRVLVQAATGSGKTRIGIEMAKRAMARNKRVLWVAHRRELITQPALAMYDLGMEPGIIMAATPGDESAHCQVASIQTLAARHMREDRCRWKMPEADLLVIDEAHHAVAGTYQKLLSHYPNAYVVGLTATPARSDGRGLGEIFDDMVMAPTIQELTDMGFLVPARYYGCYMPDLAGVRVVKGDYDEDQLESVMDNPKLVGHIAENYLRLTPDRPAVLFATRVKHSKHCRDEFINRGIRAAHLDGETPTAERKAIIDGCLKGEIQVLCQVGIATEGTDIPRWSCCIDARPTKSLSLHVQKIGRVLRTFPGKQDAVVLDHSGNWHELGFVHDITEWSLDSETTIQEREKGKKKEKKESRELTCPNCGVVFKGSIICPECGAELPMSDFGKSMSYYDAELKEVKSKQDRPKARYTTRDKEEWWRMFKYIERSRQKKGFADRAYRIKFKEERPIEWKNVIPMVPTAEVRSYETYLNIRSQYGRAKYARKTLTA